jgi:ABC-type transport system involved in multi-copper enzyme maturation permease subunit
MTAIIDNLLNILTLSWLTGPIFDKELRVSSRHKRHYFVRFAYLTILAITVAVIWTEEVRYYGNVSYQVSRMARAGMSITMGIIWFQFIAAQVIALVMLSNAISDEIYQKTLATLMTTPITSFQIVMGKLLSKLLLTILLIAISFPMLSMVRVFGGIPWDYVVSSLCLTLTSVIFVGSLSLFFSIITRKAYVSIVLTLLTLGLLFFVIPGLIILLMAWGRHIRGDSIFVFFAHLSIVLID